MKLKPQPLGWLAAIGIAVFIFEGMSPVSSGFAYQGVSPSCGSPWSDLRSIGCEGSHVGAIVIMSLAATVAVVCLVLLGILVLPEALRREHPVPAQVASATPETPGARAAVPGRLTVPDRIPAGWHPHPEDPKLMRYWTGQTYAATRERRPDE